MRLPTRRPALESVRVLHPASITPTDGPWPLSAIDRFALRWVIQGTWVFEGKPDVEALARSFERIVDAYPRLAGRVRKGEAITAGGGVPFSVAVDGAAGIDQLDVRCVDARRFADRPSPQKIARGRAPLLTARMTRLRDGWTLGVCCSHACVDGNGFFSLVRNWSEAHAGRRFPAPAFARTDPPASTLRTRDGVARAAEAAGMTKVSLATGLRYTLSLPRLHDRVYVTRFSRQALRRCKQDLASTSDLPLSTNTAIVAHCTQALARLVGLAPAARIEVSLAIDQRQRLAGVPEHFAGNAVSVALTPPVSAAAAPGEVAAKIHGTVAPLVARPSAALEAQAALVREVTAHGLPLSVIPIAHMLGKKPTLFYTNSFSTFPIYDLDFGTPSRPRKPVRAVPHDLGDPILLWPAPPDIGGIELYVGGAFARAVRSCPGDDSWWRALGRYRG